MSAFSPYQVCQMRAHPRSRSGFKGVYQRGSRNRWYVQIAVDGEHRHVGNYTDKVEAARAYDRAARKHFGRYALTNAQMGLLS